MTNESEVLDARTTPVPNTDRHGDHPGVRGQTIQLKDIQKLPLRVLSEADWQHWIARGFVVIRRVEISAHVTVSPTRPRAHGVKNHG